MRYCIAVFAFIVFTFLSFFASTCRAATYQSPKGYSLDYPDDWQTADAKQMEAAQKLTKETLKKAGENPQDLMDVIIHKPRIMAFAENINVVVTPVADALNSSSAREYKMELYKQHASAGWKDVKQPQVERITINGADALSIRTCVIMAPNAPPLEQWQVIIPGTKNTYTVTCTALASQYSACEPQFRKTIQSIKVPDPRAPEDPRYLYVTCFLCLLGAAGAVAGIAFSYFKSKGKKKVAEANP
jgi:hypothetical protein